MHATRIHKKSNDLKNESVKWKNYYEEDKK